MHSMFSSTCVDFGELRAMLAQPIIVDNGSLEISYHDIKTALQESHNEIPQDQRVTLERVYAIARAPNGENLGLLDIAFPVGYGHATPKITGYPLQGMRPNFGNINCAVVAASSLTQALADVCRYLQLPEFDQGVDEAQEDTSGYRGPRRP